METRNVFIDTQVFMREGFKFNNNRLSQLLKLGKAKLVRVIISDVVQREVSSKISEKISEVAKAKHNLLKELEILENDAPNELTEIIKRIEVDGLITIGHKRWLDYIDEANIEVLDSNSICNEELLSYYFEGKFPFSHGKKKSEFPDAISMLSLKTWLEEKNEKAYVVSDDSDFKGFCHDNASRCISIDHLSEFLDIYNRAEKRLTLVVHQYIENEKEYLISGVDNAFSTCGFNYSYDWEAEVDDVRVHSVDFDDADIIEVEDGRAIINLRAKISFSADVSGQDYSTAIWDSEDKDYIFIDDFNENLSFDEVYDVSMVVYFDEEKGEFTEIDEIEFDGSKVITLHYDDGYPYK